MRWVPSVGGRTLSTTHLSPRVLNRGMELFETVRIFGFAQESFHGLALPFAPWLRAQLNRLGRQIVKMRVEVGWRR